MSLCYALGERVAMGLAMIDSILRPALSRLEDAAERRCAIDPLANAVTAITDVLLAITEGVAGVNKISTRFKLTSTLHQVKEVGEKEFGQDIQFDVAVARLRVALK